MPFDFEYLEKGLSRFSSVLKTVQDNSIWGTPEDLKPENLSQKFPGLSEIETFDYPPLTDGTGPIARRYAGKSSPKGVMVWIHGGAFITGDLDMPEADWVSRSICAQGFEVYSLDYRKVNLETSFPKPNDDVFTGWKIAFDAAKEKSLPIHLGGGSAGAALAASLITNLMYKNLELPKSLALVYPVVHPLVPTPNEEQSAASAEIPERENFDEQVIAGMNFMYAGSQENLSNPLAFAGEAKLGEFPRTYILNSENDMLRPSGEKFGEQLSAAKVEVKMETERFSRHGQLNEPFNPAGQKSLARLLDWLNNA